MSKGDHVFARIPQAEISRSSFDRSAGVKTSFDAGFLIPVFVDEVLPGDTFNLQMTGLARLATPIFPLMDNAYLESFFFFVPNRLLWENWERFNGAQDNPDDSTDFLVPIVSAGFEGVTGSLSDYFGLPVEAGATSLVVNALPYRAYNLIWNTWFRDQNLQDSVFFYTGDGPDAEEAGADYSVLRRGKRHDYFTSCLPFLQKGPPASFSMAGSAPVVSSGAGVPSFNVGSATHTLGANPGPGVLWDPNPAEVDLTASWAVTALETDLSSATDFTINQFRQALMIQMFLERDARGGTRYTEIVRSHFGVVSPDARLQRPEYLGGGSSPLIVSQVPQTSESSGTPQGTLAAFGTVTARNHGFTQSFTEHGWIIGLVSVRADLTYQQGVERMWSRRTREEYYWPSFAQLGEQAVLNKEIFVQGTSADDEVFGYQERYGEYRYKPSRLTGLMRSNVSAPAATLDAWNLAQNFASLPVLDSDFIQEDPPFDRVIAVATEPHFIGDFHFSLRCARPMPLYGVPGLGTRL